MMQIQELRHENLKKNVHKLISSFSKIQETDKNFKKYEQNVIHILKIFRSTSLNVHQIKRKMDGLLERFKIENFPKHGDRLRSLYNDIINHPLCLEHYQSDIQWAIVDFLYEVAYDPFNELRRNPVDISKDEGNASATATAIEQPDHDLACVISVEKIVDYESSDLSDWTDIEEEQSEEEKTDENNEKSLPSKCNMSLDLNAYASKDEESIEAIESELEMYQHSWWLPGVTSSSNENEFCFQWHKFSMSKCKYETLTTTTEYCLLCEVIWMLNNPTSCKYFTLENEEIIVNKNVTLTSTTPEGLQSYLQYFVPYMKMNYVLKKFIDDVYSTASCPNTIEYYADAMREILEPYRKELLKQEQNLRQQAPGEIFTIMNLKKTLTPSFKYLEDVYNIHSMVSLDYNQNAAHICSAHLLSGLMVQVQNSYSVQHANIAMTLYLSALKYFCFIIDTWWKEGRLDDWKNEFLVEIISTNLDASITASEICGRIYDKCKEKSFFVANSVALIIKNDRILNLLMEYSLESAGLLNMLQRIDKIAALRNATTIDQENLHDVLLQKFFQSMDNFSTNSKDIPITKPKSSNDIKNEEIVDQITETDYGKLMLTKKFSIHLLACKEIISNGTEHLSTDQCKDDSSTPSSVMWKYERLNGPSAMILPVEDILFNELYNLLHTRINVANEFVVEMYKEDFAVIAHLRNIRKILFLEGSDVMYNFYVNIFTQIESNKYWPNAFSLTSQLDDTISSKHPELSSMFRVELSPDFRFENVKVTDAVDQIHVFYALKKPLRVIISEKSILKYNQIFHFLLKIKWALWTLQNLRFKKHSGKRPPYSEPKMIDLLMRRLEQLRFWLLYAVQSIHFHLTTHVLQSMGLKLEEEISKCKTFRDMRIIHDSFVDTVCEHCFQVEENSDIKLGVEQLLNLVYVLRFEWNSCLTEMENENDFSNDSVDGDTQYVVCSQIEKLENTYIRCHQYLANTLTGEVYSNHKSYLSGLSAAFNNSIPY